MTQTQRLFRHLCIACVASLSVQALAETRVMVIGMPNVAGALQKSGVNLESIANQNFPTDAAALAQRCNVVMVDAGGLTDAQQQVLETFVRGGGSAFIGAGPDWQRQSGSWLETFSAGIALDTRAAVLTTVQPTPQSPVADMPWNELPRLSRLTQTSPVDQGPMGLMAMLSPWTFSKPLWHDQWEVWALGQEPQRVAVLASARYGAGRTVIWGGSLRDRELMQWSAYGRFCRKIIEKLTPSQTVIIHPLRPVAVRGLTGPDWWRKPLQSGLAGMNSKMSIHDFMLPPESLAEAGYSASSQGEAASVVLLGDEADRNPGAGARVVLRAPKLNQALDNTDFEPKQSQVIASVSQAQWIAGGRNPESVKLPHSAAVSVANLPSMPTYRADAPRVTLPTAWRVAYQPDQDSDVDLEQKWFAADYDDRAWKTDKIGRQTTTLFGQPTGYDGAIWYRGKINVSADALTPNAALIIQTAAHHTRVYVDGKEIALEPGRVTVPMAKIGAGEHLLAIRTYGELRSNYGVTNVSAMYQPLLWRADTENRGITDGWARADISEEDWTPVSGNFGQESAGFESKVGWLRIPVDVPNRAAPFVMLAQHSLNDECRVFVNGQLVETSGFLRAGRFVIDGRHFKSGRNIVAVRMRFLSLAERACEFQIASAEPVIYRATVKAGRDGQSLMATLNYNGQGHSFYPWGASLSVNGRTVGGWIGNSGGTPILLAAHALKAGDNQVEIRLKRAPGGDSECGLKSLDVVELPEKAAVPLAGWEKLAQEKLNDTWYAGEGSDWTPADGNTLQQDRNRTWISTGTPDLSDVQYAYRTTLWLSKEQLARNLTLQLRTAMVERIFVNGVAVYPDDEFYYSLNAALKEGANTLVFATQDVNFRGLATSVAAGRDRMLGMPLLRSDVAPLIPAHPLAGAYRLNRVFPVARWQAPADGEVLFRWPNGATAAVLRTVEGRKEIALAPGLLDNVLPGPNLGARTLQSGGNYTIEYHYGQYLNRDVLRGERIEQLIPMLLGIAEGRPAFITDLAGKGENAEFAFNQAFDKTPCVLAWRMLDWQGQPLSSGTRDVTTAGNSGSVRVPFPALDATDVSRGAAFGRYVHVRAALLSADRTQVYGVIEKTLTRGEPVSAAVRLPLKTDEISSANESAERRVMHRQLDQIGERYVFLPGEPVRIKAYVTNNGAEMRSVTAVVSAVGGIDQQKISQSFQLTLLPWQQQLCELVIPPGATQTEQPWAIRVEVHGGADLVSTDQRSVMVAAARGEIRDLQSAIKQGRNVGGYMWFMQPSAYAMEHRRGTDSRSFPPHSPWWVRVRENADGNWLIAQGVHRGLGDGDQQGLMWGDFYNQTRAEITDSYGWFPNGVPIRQWWAPYAMREPLRRYGRREVVMDMSDWWQYDAGYPIYSFNTMAMFNEWLKAHAGQTIAGRAIEGKPIEARTLAEMVRVVNEQYKELFRYFQAEGLADVAAYTGKQLTAVAPGSTQSGQGSYATWLPSTSGGVLLGPTWAGAESHGILDADNHPFAADWQYALESATFRALGITNTLSTHWESPQRYHRIVEAPVDMIPMGPAQWQRRQLDSRWQVIADTAGTFKRVLNLTHNEYMSDIHTCMMQSNLNKPGATIMPFHWWINDRLAALAMTLSPQKPLTPLLVVGESDLTWDYYYGMLGKLRASGLNLGGAVSIAQLDKLKPEELPGLVWAPAERVDSALADAIERKIKAGVPLLLIGKVPEVVGDPERMMRLVGVQRAGENPASNAQTVSAEYRSTAEEAAIASVPAGSNLAASHFVAAGMKATVTRGGRLLVGAARPPLKVVFYGALSPLHSQDDPMARRLAVSLFQNLVPTGVEWPAGAGGYAFKDEKGHLFIVVENHQARKQTIVLPVDAALMAPGSRAADLLAGSALAVSSVGGKLQISVTLGPSDGTIIMMAPADGR